MKTKIMLIIFGLMLSLGSCNIILHQIDFDKNYAAWQAHNINSYSFKYHKYDPWEQYNTFFGSAYPITVVVENNIVVSAINNNGMKLSYREYNPSYFRTIQKCFTDLGNAIDGNEETTAQGEISITYDPIYNYPSEVLIDPSSFEENDEYGWTITEFTIL